MDYILDEIRHTVMRDGATLTVDGSPVDIVVLSTSPQGMEFLLNNSYHKIRYADESPSQITVEVDGTPLTLKKDTGLDEIVYKNSGGAGALAAESALLSQIPGKVVSVDVSAGDDISEGDTVCVLESMKMQVSVKAHASGKVKSIRAKTGASVAKGDLIAEIE